MTLDTALLAFLSLGQIATFIGILRLGIQYGRDSTQLQDVRNDVDEMRPKVEQHGAALAQHDWRLGSHDARLNTNEAAIEHLRIGGN